MDSPHRRRGGRGLRVTVPVLVGVALVACGSGAAEADARAAAGAFVAEAGADAAAACERLAPETRRTVEEEAGSGCQDVIGELVGGDPGPVESVAVAGHGAQVRFAGDTVFLALFDDGWRVTAAGCRRVSADPSEPYDCDVEGG